jgi:hypothetical protein
MYQKPNEKSVFAAWKAEISSEHVGFGLTTPLGFILAAVLYLLLTYFGTAIIYPPKPVYRLSSVGYRTVEAEATGETSAEYARVFFVNERDENWPGLIWVIPCLVVGISLAQLIVAAVVFVMLGFSK